MRGTAVAAFATFVASFAHTLGGGSAPGPIAVMVALAFSVPLAVVLTGARVRLLRTALAAVIAQAAVHLTYAMGTAAPLDSSPSAGRHHDAVQLLPALPVATVDHGHAWMPLAHLAAAILTLAALMLADRVLEAFGRAVRMLVQRLTVIPAPIAAPALHVPADAARPRLVAVLLASGLGSRGPPVELAAA